MDNGNTHTADEIEAIGERLFAMAKETGSVLAVAAVLSEDEDSGGIATKPEALIAGSLGALRESEVAVLLVQIEVAALTLISKMAPDAEMGEEAFQRVVRTARTHMLDAEGLGLCDDCGG